MDQKKNRLLPGMKLTYFDEIYFFYNFLAEIVGEIIDNTMDSYGTKYFLMNEPEKNILNPTQEKIPTYLTLCDEFPVSKILNLFEKSKTQEEFTVHSIIAAQDIAQNIINKFSNKNKIDIDIKNKITNFDLYFRSFKIIL
jgi:hypothetical protein